MRTLAALLLLSSPLVAEDLPAVLALKTAANAFLASLDEPRAAKASLPFDDDERENWHYFPMERGGLSLEEMNEAQKNAAVGLVTAALSEEGALKAAQIISLEKVLAAIENDQETRDQEKYYVAIFGKPGDETGWGFRIEGHHLSINIALVGEHGISVTPSFMGANPAKVADGEMKGMRPLAGEEDLARSLAIELIRSGSKESVLFSEDPPKEILTAQDRVAKRLEAVGMPAGEMTEAQRASLLALISEYTGRYRDDLASADMTKIRKAGIEKIRFGWAGGTAAGEPYYYRIQGPTFLMEACNVQNGANHQHTVWRDFDGDFGRDLLKQHLEEQH